MIDKHEISRIAQYLAADVIRQAHELLAGEKVDVTQDEAEAILLTTLATAAAIEAHAILALPPDKAANVRAFVERLTHDIQVVRNLHGKKIIQCPSTPPPTPKV